MKNVLPHCSTYNKNILGNKINDLFLNSVIKIVSGSPCHARMQVNLNTWEQLIFKFQCAFLYGNWIIVPYPHTSTYSTSTAHLQGLTGFRSWLGRWRWKFCSTSCCESLRSEPITPIVIHATGTHAVILPAWYHSKKY